MGCGPRRARLLILRKIMSEKVRLTPALTPAQWLPKPATSQFPERRRSLRELWSPEERVSDATRRVILTWWLQSPSYRRGLMSAGDDIVFLRIYKLWDCDEPFTNAV